jgi:hypothetical protein
MQVDKNPFSVSTIDLQNSKVLIRPEQVEAAKGKNVIISEKRTITVGEKILSREVVVEKTTDGKESLNITIKAPTLGGGGQAQATEETAKQLEALKPVRPVRPGGAQHHRSDRPSSPWTTENFQAEESREREVKDK